jgi:undecaprenyl-diphosphatase
MSLLLVTALILGAVEGLTEFLPVSSTGHLIIVGDMLNFNDERAKTFEIFIQLGAILSVVWHYRVKLWTVATTLNDRSAQRFVLNLAIGFTPAAVVGLLLHRYIKAYLFNPTTVALALIIGGALILLIEHRPRPTRVDTLEQLSPTDALKVGLAQTAALFPGISRAGATIMGGMVSGLSRPVATEFSFFLAIPTMFAATIFELYTNRKVFAFDDLWILLVGFVIAFITALIVIRAFLHYVSRHNFVPFAYYRIVFGLLVLAYFW